jgi:hypothetical protein
MSLIEKDGKDYEKKRKSAPFENPQRVRHPRGGKKKQIPHRHSQKTRLGSG